MKLVSFAVDFFLDVRFFNGKQQKIQNEAYPSCRYILIIHDK